MERAEIDTIGRTGFEVAALRAVEDRRPDRLFADPYAAVVLAAAGFPVGPSPVKRDFEAIMGEQVAVRTRFLDEALLADVREGCGQVVLVASGMDARAWRLDWPAGVALFELDQPGVLGFKDEVLLTRGGPRCVRRVVPVDLRADWTGALVAAGFRPGERTAWLVEGLLYALDEAAADRLMAQVTGVSAPGSRVAFDHIEGSVALRAALIRMHPDLVGLWRSGPSDPAGWLRRHGWSPQVREFASLARQYGRRAHPAYDPRQGGAAHAWLGRALLRPQQNDNPARS